MRGARSTIGLLVLAQVLITTNNIVNVALTGIVGYAYATDKIWATLPITLSVVGTALATLPASLLMKKIGRRAGFITGCGIGIAGGLICCFATLRSSFWLLVIGSFVSGGYNAFGQFYRFAAAEAVEASRRSKAIAFVLAGGVGGAILGPEGSKLTKDALATPYLGAYLFLVGCAVAALAIQVVVRLPDVATPAAGSSERHVRPLREILSQPLAIAAISGSVVAFFVMTLLMTATPLAMIAHRHAYAATAFVIAWHAVAMFAPSLVSGHLIARFGVSWIMISGALLMLSAVCVALVGTSVAVFWLALVLLGLGWNFLYVGGTTLLMSCYRASERSLVQGVNDMLVFSASAAASLLAGFLLQRVGWTSLLWMSAVPTLALLAPLAWLVARRAGHKGAATTTVPTEV